MCQLCPTTLLFAAVRPTSHVPLCQVGVSSWTQDVHPPCLQLRSSSVSNRPSLSYESLQSRNTYLLVQQDVIGWGGREEIDNWGLRQLCCSRKRSVVDLWWAIPWWSGYTNRPAQCTGIAGRARQCTISVDTTGDYRVKRSSTCSSSWFPLNAWCSPKLAAGGAHPGETDSLHALPRANGASGPWGGHHRGQ